MNIFVVVEKLKQSQYQPDQDVTTHMIWAECEGAIWHNLYALDPCFENLEKSRRRNEKKQFSFRLENFSQTIYLFIYSNLMSQILIVLSSPAVYIQPPLSLKPMETVFLTVPSTFNSEFELFAFMSQMHTCWQPFCIAIYLIF